MSQCTLYLDIPGLTFLRGRIAELLPDYEISGDPRSGGLSLAGGGQRVSLYLRGTGLDAEAFYANMTDMYKYYESVESDRPEIKAQLLRHLPLFNSSIGVVTEAEMPEDLFAALQKLAEELGGLLLLPPANLYNGQGQLVFDIAGRSELDEYVIGKSSEFFARPRATASGEARKERSNKLLAEQGVPLNLGLPPIVSDEEARPRGKDEIIDRLLALTLSSVHAEITRDRNARAAREGLSWFVERYHTDALLSPDERAFVQSDAPEQQAVIDFAWRYECLWAAAWALGLVAELPYPDSICDVPALTGLIAEFKSREELAKRCKLRGAKELLDQADLIYRYDWACIEAMLKKEPAPCGLNGEVVFERHRLFNWLIRYDDADWDGVRTDT